MDKDGILGRLAELNISQITYNHVPVMTSADLTNVREAIFSPLSMSGIIIEKP